MKMRTLTVIVGLLASSTEIACGGETDTGNKRVDVTGAGGTDGATETGGHTTQETGGSGGTAATGGSVASGGAVASGGTAQSGGTAGMATGGIATTGGTGGATGGTSGDGGSGGASGSSGGIVVDGGPQFMCDPTSNPSYGCDECAQVKCCAEWEDCVNDPSGVCLSAGPSGSTTGDMPCVIACTDSLYASYNFVTAQDVETCAAHCGDGGGPVGVDAEALIACLLAVPADGGGERNCALQCFSVF